MVAPRRGPLLRTAWVVHRLAFRASGGRVGTRVGGLPVLELVTTGRTSGRPRPVLLNYRRHPRGWVVVASNAGHDQDPAWWRNLERRPRARVRVGRRTQEVVARRLQGQERDEQWRAMVSANPDYEEYRGRTERPIPVVLLERVED